MENLKIRVNGEVENKEAQGIFKILGGSWSEHVNADHYDKEFLYLTNGVIEYDDLLYEFLAVDECKEITLPELRDMVVLKRNDVGDANAFRHDNGVKYYITSDNKYYYFSNLLTFEWTESCNDIDYLEKHVKPIEKPMKEYLRKNSNGTYSYIGTVRPEHVSDFMIEIPDGAEVATKAGTGVSFWKDSGVLWWRRIENKWCKYFDLNHHIEKCGHELIWQRPTHPEELPFIDDEPYSPDYDGSEQDELESLNDQYAEIEKVRQTLNQRQEQYGSFEDVAMITEQMVDVMRKGYYENLAYNQKMALYMICSKMARIVNGNPNHKDSWHDIAGYATLIDNELVSEKDMPF